MPTFKEELARMLWLQNENKISPDAPCKVVLPRLEAQKRVSNKGERTRLIRELDDTETYSQFNFQFDRYIELCGGNPSIAYSLMLRLLEQLTDDMIRRLAADEQSTEKESLSDA